MTSVAREPEPRGTGTIGRSLIIAMSIAAGVAIANIDYSQPMLGRMEQA